MADTKESLVEFAAPRLTDESAAAISKKIHDASDESIASFVEALDSTTEEIVDLLPDDIESKEAVSEMAFGIAQQVGGVATTALGLRIGVAYLAEHQEGVKAA